MSSAHSSHACYEAEPLSDSPQAEAAKAERTLLAHVHAVNLSSWLRARLATHVLSNPRRANPRHATNPLAANAQPHLARFGLSLEAAPLARWLPCGLATRLLRNPSRRSLRYRTIPPRENADPGLAPFGAKLGRQHSLTVPLLRHRLSFGPHSGISTARQGLSLHARSSSKPRRWRKPRRRRLSLAMHGPRLFFSVGRLSKIYLLLTEATSVSVSTERACTAATSLHRGR